MKIHILIRFTNHDADVEFNRITAVTDIAADDYHRDNIEVYIITICSQCVTPHASPTVNTCQMLVLRSTLLFLSILDE